MHEYLIRRNAVFAAIDAGRRTIHKLWLQSDLNRQSVDDILHAASEQHIVIQKASKKQLSELAGDSRHQGVVLEVDPYAYSSVESIFALAARRDEKPLLLLLDLLHGPQNIGSLLRTAEICGVHGVIIQDRRAPDITPAVVQYSAGASEYLLVSQVTNLVSTIDGLKERGVWVAGLDIDENARAPGGIDLDLPLALIVGHEGSGLRRLVKKRCDFIVQLPMRGHTESLNAAVAGSIALYAAWQARSYEGFGAL
ncbi:MAG: 23S rRNA (guanosine(2251)-2'-O)-methyltransferase RlmB [Candidatus Promineifilaceae bacterium]